MAGGGALFMKINSEHPMTIYYGQAGANAPPAAQIPSDLADYAKALREAAIAHLKQKYPDYDATRLSMALTHLGRHVATPVTIKREQQAPIAIAPLPAHVLPQSFSEAVPEGAITTAGWQSGVQCAPMDFAGAHGQQTVPIDYGNVQTVHPSQLVPAVPNKVAAAAPSG